MKVTCPIKEITVTQRSLATALGLTGARVNQMAQEGVAVRNEKDKGGGVFLFDSLKNYWTSKNKGGSQEDSGDDTDYMAEKAKHEKVKREIAELKLAKMESRVYDARTVELVITEMLSNLRTQLMGLPPKVSVALEMKSREEIYTVLNEDIEACLAELSEYTPEMFAEEAEFSGDEDS